MPPPTEGPHVQIKLHSTMSTVTPGKPFTVIIEQLIEPEWHTYWVNPGDSGTPTSVTWQLNGGQADALQFPIPQRISYGPLTNFGYDTRALYTADITPPAKIDTPDYALTAYLEWLVCKDICLPESGTYTLRVPVASGDPAPNLDVSDLVHDVTATHPVIGDDAMWGAGYRDQGDQTLVTFTPPEQAAAILAQGGSVEFFPVEWGLIQNPGEQVLALMEGGDAVLAIPKGDRPRDQLISPFLGLFVINDGQGHRQGYQVMMRRTEDLVAGQQEFEKNLEDHREQFDKKNAERLSRVDVSFFVALISAFLGGLILNLMPCVFPVLSLKALSLVKLSGAERAHVRMHGLAYAAGVLGTFLVIASILMILKQTGAAVGWGFQLQQPWVIVLLSQLFLWMGLNLLGWFEINLMRLVPARFHTTHDGILGSVGTGVLATLVATPCTAPFMGAALGYALLHHPALGLMIFAMLGVGLALPFTVLTFVPHLYRYLPRPGVWMVHLREFLAFPMLATALWLLWVLGHQVGVDAVAMVLLASLAAIFLLWVRRFGPGLGLWRALRVLGLIVAFLVMVSFTFFAMTPEITSSTKEISGSATQLSRPYTTSELMAALATDQPVFVNMTADWCITCKVNERLAISTATVTRAFEQTGTIYIKGDWTNYNAEITRYLASFGRGGVPLYVVYPAPKDGVRPEPVVLPQILTPGVITTALNPMSIK